MSGGHREFNEESMIAMTTPLAHEATCTLDRACETSSHPLVGVGLPVFNGELYLRSALESLLTQDYPNFELVISDNASTDRTPEICQEFVARDARITYHRGDRNRGASWNFNHVFELSRGEFFMWAAHDDLWHPSFISRCVQALQARPDAVVCHSQARQITCDGNPNGVDYVNIVVEAPTPEGRFGSFIRDWSVFTAIYGLMRRDVMARVRRLQPVFFCDGIFISELLVHGTIIQVPEVLQSKRQYPADRPEYSHDELLKYLGGQRRGKLELGFRDVFRNCLAGHEHAGVPPRLRRRMRRDAVRVYLGRNLWWLDLKNCAIALIGPDWSRRYRRCKESLKAARRLEYR